MRIEWDNVRKAQTQRLACSRCSVLEFLCQLPLKICYVERRLIVLESEPGLMERSSRKVGTGPIKLKTF